MTKFELTVGQMAFIRKMIVKIRDVDYGAGGALISTPTRSKVVIELRQRAGGLADWTWHRFTCHADVQDPLVDPHWLPRKAFDGSGAATWIFEDGMVTVRRDAKRRFTTASAPEGTGMPKLPEGYGAWPKVSAERWKLWASCAEKDFARPVINAVVVKDGMVMVTDSYRLLYQPLPLPDIAIPGPLVQTTALVGGNVTVGAWTLPVQASLGGDVPPLRLVGVCAQHGDWSYRGVMNEMWGQYPDVRQLIPDWSQCAPMVEIEKPAEFAKALRRLPWKDSSHAVKFLASSSVAEQREDTSEGIPHTEVPFAGKVLQTTAYHPHYLADLIADQEGPVVVLGDGEKPAGFIDADDGVRLLMPVRMS